MRPAPADTDAREGILIRTGWTGAAMLAALLFGLNTTAHADAAADRCGGAKLKAAGRYGQALLNCNATATRRNETLDPECTSRASGKLASSFNKAEDKGGCVTTDDEGTTSAALGTDVDAVLTALAPDPTDAARTCAASKMKSAGKQIRAILTCSSKGASKSEGPDPDCLAKADEKLVISFSKADDNGGCTTVADASTIDGIDTDASEEQVAALSPVCGDSILGPTQECDGSDDLACPGICSVVCSCDVPPDCGDGAAELPEECDDGNEMSGDGCSAACVLEDASALCDGVPSTPGEAIDAVLVSSDFDAPIHATAPPLDPARLFVVEREGRVRILNLEDNTIEPTAFLDIVDIVDPAGEGGLLSMAFDPDYDSNRRFFLYYTNNSGNIVIARYLRSLGDPDVADESTGEELLEIAHPGQSNHNGGQVAFGADGYLYAGTGDGGGGGDPNENAQDDTAMLGKLLRIDVDVNSAPFYQVPPTNPGYVDGSSELELIWAKGLRNPWRFSFDRSTGDLVIADVGQGSVEEIDFQAAASTGAENYGWDIFEGTDCHEPDPAPMCPAPPTGFTMPIFEYAHSGGCTSITGGFVYRGCAMPDYASTYFYSDVCHNFVRTIDITGGVASNAQNRTADATSAGAVLTSVVSFGEDARGELYILDLGGSVYRIEPE